MRTVKIILNLLSFTHKMMGGKQSYRKDMLIKYYADLLMFPTCTPMFPQGPEN